jgi:peptidoglycan/LPS O-acetylase OafA/YrhL
MTTIRMLWLSFASWLSQWPWVYAAFIAVASVDVGCLVHILIERPITRALKRRLSYRAGKTNASNFPLAPAI